MIRFRLQQHPLAVVLGTDGTGATGQQREQGGGGSNRMRGGGAGRGESESLPTCGISSPSLSTPGNQAIEIAPEPPKIQTRFKRGG